MPLEPFTAVVVASYGGPDGPDDVLPFLRNATRGRGIPDERLAEVAEHYHLHGGRSPINARNAELLDALRAELRARGVDVPVVIGNRNWGPYLTDVVADLADEGHTRVLGLATSAYQSYSNCRQYWEDFTRATDGQSIEVAKLDPFWDDPAFAEANARRVVAAWRGLRGGGVDGPVRLLFVTHSIPASMDERAGSGDPGDRYVAQHLVVAERVAALAARALDEEPTWELTYCSRSGPPRMPWLEPDVNDRIEDIAGDVAGVVLAPIGFIADHMEVVHDLDTEAAATARRLGLAFARAGTVGTDEGFVGMLAARLLARAACERQGRTPKTRCRFDTGTCCQPPNPGART